MHEALGIAIGALSGHIAIEEAAADALFAASVESARSGFAREADAFGRLARRHRVRILALQAEIALLRDTAVRHFRNRA